MIIRTAAEISEDPDFYVDIFVFGRAYPIDGRRIFT